MLQEALSLLTNIAKTFNSSVIVTDQRPIPHRTLHQRLAGVLILAMPVLLAHTSANAAVMNVLYEGYYLDASSVWDLDQFGNPSSKPAGTIEHEQDYGSLLSSMPANNGIDVSSNTAWSSARNQSSLYGDSLYIDVSTNVDDQVPDSATNPQFNYARSMWNSLFSISGSDASLDIFGYYLNTDYWTSEIYLLDLTDFTIDRFGHTGDSRSKVLEDGHLYALSALSSQVEMGLDDRITTGFYLNSVSINKLLAADLSARPATFDDTEDPMGRSLITSLDQAYDIYSPFIDIPEPATLLLLASGLIGLARIRQVDRSKPQDPVGRV